MLLDAFRLSHKHTQALVQCILQLKDDKKLISIQCSSFADESHERVWWLSSLDQSFLASRLANFYFYFFDISIYARQLAVEEKSYHSSSLNCNRKFLSEKKSRVMRESKTTKTQQLDEESEKKKRFSGIRGQRIGRMRARQIAILSGEKPSRFDDGGWRKISIKI